MYYGSNPPQRRTSVVTKKIAPMSQLAQRHPLHPLMVVIGVLIVALTAKIGHGMWGVGAIFAFYPAYLIILIAGSRFAAVLDRSVRPAASTIRREEATGIPRYKRYQIASRRHPPNMPGSHGGTTADAVS